VSENRVLRRIFGRKRKWLEAIVYMESETWSVSIREEHRHRMSEQNIFTQDGRWRKLHNEELHNLYSSPN
jgi:hypothetical protein